MLTVTRNDCFVLYNEYVACKETSTTSNDHTLTLLPLVLYFTLTVKCEVSKSLSSALRSQAFLTAIRNHTNLVMSACFSSACLLSQQQYVSTVWNFMLRDSSFPRRVKFPSGFLWVCEHVQQLVHTDVACHKDFFSRSLWHCVNGKNVQLFFFIFFFIWHMCFKSFC